MEQLQVQSVSSMLVYDVYCIALTEPLTVPTVPGHILIL